MLIYCKEGKSDTIIIDHHNLLHTYLLIWNSEMYHYFFSRLCWQIEDRNGGGSDEDTGENQIEKIVEGFPPDDEVKCYIWIRFWTTVIIPYVTSIG